MSASTNGFDMRLSRLPIFTPYVDTSYTKVKLAPGLCGKVTFEPWSEFDKVVKKTKKTIDTFPPCGTSYSAQIFDTLRKSLEPASADYHEERQQWYILRRAQKSQQASQEPSPGTIAETGGTSSVNISENADRQEGTTCASTEESGTSAYTNAKSCAFLFENVFKIVEDIVRGLRMSDAFHVLPELTLNSEIARAYDVSTGPADYCTLTPDQALATNQERPANTLPVCSFELKGPLREFWPTCRRSSATSKRSVKKQRVHYDGKLDTGVHEEFQPDKISTIVRKEDAYNYSAECLAEFYNELFKNSSILNEGSRKIYYFTFLPVAQALSQALLSGSGCCALYNFQEVVAFQVLKQPVCPKGNSGASHVVEQKEEAPSLLVRVSRAFPCDEEPGNICAIIALADYSCDEVIKIGKRKEIRELFNEVTDAFIDWKLNETGDKKNPSSKEKETGPDNEGENKESDASTEAKQSTSGAIYQYCTDPSSSCSDASADGNTKSNIMTEGNDMAFTKKLTKIIRNNDGVIGNGASAVVIGGTYEGRKVAIKSWNGVSPDGVESLRNEIQVYRDLTLQGARVLGIGIPCMRMSRMIPAHDAVLVVDNVGRGIHRRADGSLVFCDVDVDIEQEKRIDEGDIDDICHAAIESLRLLHDSGVLHGDIALRNLRVQQRKEAGIVNGVCRLHSPQTCGFFDIPVDHVYASVVLENYINDKKLNDITVVAPDVGGVQRARAFAKGLSINGAPLAIIDKRRDGHSVAKVLNLVGNVEGKTAILVDDMIDTAGTICEAAKMLRERGARQVFAMATHAVFSGPAVERLSSGVFEEVILTNTINIPPEKQFKQLRILSISHILGEQLWRVHEQSSR